MVQVSDDELISEFSVFDVNVDDDAILDKRKICRQATIC